MTLKISLPNTIIAFSAGLSIILTGCDGQNRSAGPEAELEELLESTPPLAELTWEDIRTIGLPLAIRQAVSEKCLGGSQGEFSNFLFDLNSVGVPEELIEDIRESGEYVKKSIACEESFIRLSAETAFRAQEIWHARMKIERVIQARGQ